MEELREDHDDGTVARVAAIDIAKASGMVCLRVPHDTIEGRRVQKVWTVASTTNTILELGDRLLCQGVERVVMEATGSYWRPFFYLLEARGLDCWLAKLAERGMVRASFVPPKPVRQLRDYTRTRTVFVQERTRHKHRVDKALQDAQIKLSDVVSDLFGMSGRAMLDALVAGERNPRTLADLAKSNLVKKKPALIEAPDRQFEDHHARLLRLLLGTGDHLTAQLGELDRLIARTLEEIATPPDRSGTGSEPATTVSPRVLAERLDAVPGTGPATAQIILAEIGADLSGSPRPNTSSPGQSCAPEPSSPARRTDGSGRAGQPLAQGRPRRGRQLRRPHRHLPRRPLPPHRQTPRPRQSPGRRRPLDTRHRLAPDQRPRRLLPGARRRLAPTPPRPRPQDPRPPAPGPRPPSRHHPGISLTGPSHRHPVRSRPGCCRLPS